MRRGRTTLALVLGLLLLTTPAVQAAFPGANGRIAFSYGGAFDGPSDLDPAGTFRRIADMRPGGGPMRTLRGCAKTQGEPPKDNCSIDYRAPAYSPDGSLIAFDAGYRLGLMHSDGSGLRLLPQRAYDDGQPAFSPDGERLVFTGFRSSGDPRLYVHVLESGRTRRLTRFESRHPAWSTRNWIAFERGRYIYAVRPTGKGLRRITGDAGWDPDWSPGGRRLAFVSSGGIHVRSGGRVRPLRQTGRLDQLVANPAWSPDGRRIAFSTLEGIWTIGVDGRALRNIVKTEDVGTRATGAEDPSWQPVQR